MINPVAAGELHTLPHQRAAPRAPTGKNTFACVCVCGMIKYRSFKNQLTGGMCVQQHLNTAPGELFQFSSILEPDKRGTEAALR